MVEAPTGAGAPFKDEGNTHFKAGAFLKVSKVGKALEDAEKCLSLAPQFVKGYHRKASALHASERTDEAVEVLLTAIELGLDNNELVRMGITIKGKAFVPLAAAAEPPKAATKPASAPAQPGTPAAGTHLY